MSGFPTTIRRAGSVSLWLRLTGVAGLVLIGAATSRAEFPYPACGACPDPSDYKAYLFTPTTSPPVLPSEVGAYDYRASSLVDPSLPATPEELGGVAGMSIDRAWQLSTGRPDVVVAHLDSGIVYDTENVNKAALNTGELPLPEGSPDYDANNDGVFNIKDYASDSRVSDVDGNGIEDPRDLIIIFSDSVDGDGNGYVDDICGWDAFERDNDPFDDVGYGHGSGVTGDFSDEVNNGGGWGVAPNAMFIPVKVGDSFVADGNDFGAGVAYAVDGGATIISEALGALDNTPLAQQALEHAYRSGVAIIASAADEQSYHHNFPSMYNHSFWANSVRSEDGLLVTDPTNLLLNGCTNYGGRAQVAIASNSCSSEATGRAAGIMALIYSHAKNQVERGVIADYPGSTKPLSPTEAYQLLMMTADDIDFSGVSRSLTVSSLMTGLIPGLTSTRFPSQTGYDKYFGYGRANVRAALDAIDAGTIPPEADIVEPGWFTNIDATVTPTVDITGTVAAKRNANLASFVVDWGCGVDPAEADFAVFGHQLVSMPLGGTAIEDGLLATFDVTGVAAECLFDGLTLPRTDEDEFDESYAITIRVTVVDTLGNVAQARRNVTVHHDATLLAGFPLQLGASGDSAPVLHDMDGDGHQDIVIGTAAGQIHVFRSDGSEPAGWPVQTALLPLVTASPSLQPAALGSDFHSAILAPVAVGDLDGDGFEDVVAADLDGSVYAFAADGSALPGFPVTLNPVYSAPSIRNEANRLDAAVSAAPTLADLDGDGKLEILVAAHDRHLYAWKYDGTSLAGFPALIVDQERMASVDATTHQVSWKLDGGQPVGSIGTKLLSSPAVGDLDGDGDLEIVLGSNEEYVRGEEANFYLNDALFNVLKSSFDLPNSRAYALSRLGRLDPDVAANPSGPFLAGWPVRIGMLIADLLPSVGHGINAAPVLADVDSDGDDEVFINGCNGPAYLLQGDGSSYFGSFQGKYRILNPKQSAAANPQAGSSDYPLTFALLGGAAAADLLGDGGVDFALPSIGTKQLLDAQAPALQGPGDHQLMAWSLDGPPLAPISDGVALPAFPQIVEDMQFLASPAVADIDGDGVAELLEGSGGYLLHAFSAAGGEAAGWPKFTGGWMVGSAAPGDIDGDGLLDVVAVTREGQLYAWATSAAYDSAGATGVQWATLARDRHRSGNLNSGVAMTSGADGCTSEYRAIMEKAKVKIPAGAANDKFTIQGFANLTGHALDPVGDEVAVQVGGPDGAAFEVAIAAGSFKSNGAGTKFTYSAPAPGLTKMILQLKKGLWRYKIVAKDVDATPADVRVFVRLRVGGTCLQRVRTCEMATNGQSLKCVKPKIP
ncbi:MAG: VCBS repeat-containing protein [Deltaproteobacteria bacterium]|nr:VCBS repeat-containing protein [Deltaproteobacteria bacterium]